MKKKLISGRQRSIVGMKSLDINIGNFDIYVAAHQSFPVSVCWLYENRIPETEDEPGVDEYAQVLSVKLVSSQFFFNKKGYSLSISSEADLMDVLDKEQVSEILDSLLSQGEGSFIWVDGKYVDPDTTRPAVNDKVKQELGFGLMGAYE